VSTQPFFDQLLQRALPERARRQQMLMTYLRSTYPELQRVLAAKDERRLRELQEEMSAKQEAILFDALPGERQRYLLQYGCAAWTPQALTCCAEHSPLIELGAGAGQWCRALRKLPTGLAHNGVEGSVDIVAFDDGSEVPEAVRQVSAEGVSRGGVEVLRQSVAEGRTLLLVYPPPDDMAMRCLTEYRGDLLIYVGEGRGGYNGNDAFFDALERAWRVKRVLPLRPFPGGHEKLFFLKRRHAWIRERFGRRK